MAITKQITEEGRNISYHEVLMSSAVFSSTRTSVSVRLCSWVDETAKLDGVAGLEWVIRGVQNCYDILSKQAVELALVDSGTLAGGVISTELTDTSPLEHSKYKQRLKIKAAKSVEITSPLTTPYGIFDCDAESEKRITGAIMMLQTLEGMGTPTTVDFVLADNSVVTLTTAQMVEVGLIMGARVQAAISKASSLRSAIEAATTVEDVEAIVWA